MPKTRDVPTELREFNSLFSIIARRYDPARVFDDFLTLVICCLARQTQEDWYHDTIRKYDEDEINTFAKLLGELFKYYHKEIEENSWCDPLGEFYEVLSGSYKKSNFGQFFTPKCLCDMLAQLTIPKGTFGKNILEPACGSGRMILAIQSHSKGNYFVAKDLDHTCVKMTCINLAFHGIKAEVHHVNALSDDKPFNSYIINKDFYKTKMPFIYKMAG